jgi:hypothetical protein
MLKPLPDPDWLDVPRPTAPVCILTDDGSPTTTKLADLLTHQGWKVVVLSFPATIVPHKSALSAGIERVILEDMSETHLQTQLTAIATRYGIGDRGRGSEIGAFIHLNPLFSFSRQAGLVYDVAERAIAKCVFLVAKHLKPSLTTAAQTGRSYFLTVARLDGVFGTSHEVNFGAIGAGLFGLTKTLNQEWTQVFCRAIDLAPSLDPEVSAQCILAEMHDPNLGLMEVGYSSQGRVALIAQI